MANSVKGGGAVFEDIDWDVISAVSNITLSILTFIGLMITLYFSVNNSFYKLKIDYRIHDDWQMKVINKRNVPVHIMTYGFMYKNKEGKELLIGGKVLKSDAKRLDWNEVVRFSMSKVEIQNKLFDLGESEGRLIRIFAYVKTEEGKMHRKRLQKISPIKEQEVKLTLNKDWATKHLD